MKLKIALLAGAAVLVAGAAQAEEAKPIVDLSDFKTIDSRATERGAVTTAENELLPAGTTVAGFVSASNTFAGTKGTPEEIAAVNTARDAVLTEIAALQDGSKTATTDLKTAIEAYEANYPETGTDADGVKTAINALVLVPEDGSDPTGTVIDLVNARSTLATAEAAAATKAKIVSDIASDENSTARFVAGELADDVLVNDETPTDALAAPITRETALKSFVAVDQKFAAQGELITKNTADIAKNTSRIVALEDEVDNLKGGVAMAIAMANAPVVSGGANNFSLSGGFGTYDGEMAASVKAAFMPVDNVAISASVATDFKEGFAAGGGVGFAF